MPAPGRRPKARPRALPELTVAVPAYNAAGTLAQCLASLVDGAPAGLVEVVVVDDGSTDDSAGVAQRYVAAHPEVVRLVRQPNRGHGGAINTGLREARGRYFRVVDADDWVDAAAFAAFVARLPSVDADIVLTDYAEAWPVEAGPRRVPLFARLRPGVPFSFEDAVRPGGGFSSWGVILATSTFRTVALRRAGLALTERSAYVDMEYVTLGLEHLDTLVYLDLDVYRYRLGQLGQSVSDESYRRRYRQHEAVFFRLSDFVRDTPALSPGKRAYVVDRVLPALLEAHVRVLEGLPDGGAALATFRRRCAAYDFLAGRGPLSHRARARKTLARAARRVLPAKVAQALSAEGRRDAVQLVLRLAREVTRRGPGRRRAPARR